jgi:HEPN domain-containing protein
VRELLASLSIAVSDAVFEQATFLDRFYIPTRYPNGLPAGVPHDYFSREDAAQAIAAAEAIHVWCQSHLPGA